MKNLALALGLCVLGATAASAQSIEFRAGGDRGWDGSRTVRTEVRRDRGWDDDRVEVRRRRDVYETGNVGSAAWSRSASGSATTDLPQWKQANRAGISRPFFVCAMLKA